MIESIMSLTSSSPCALSGARLARGEARKAKGPVAGDAAWTAPLVAATQADRPYFERCFAARALGAFKGHDAQLVELTRDDDPRIVIAAIRGLATNESGPQASKVVDLAGHAEDLVLETAVDALVRWAEINPVALKIAERKLQGRNQMRAHIALTKVGRKVGSFDSGGDAALAEEYAWGMENRSNGIAILVRSPRIDR